jgi:hypothetical protein
VAQWLRQTYPALRRRARRNQASVFFLDEAGFSSEPNLGRSYGLRGHTPVVRTSGQPCFSPTPPRRTFPGTASALTNVDLSHLGSWTSVLWGGLAEAEQKGGWAMAKDFCFRTGDFLACQY